MNDKRKYTVDIFGDQYLLMSDNSEEMILKVSAMIDSFMKDIAKRSGSRDHKRIAVLAALQVGSLLLHNESLQEKVATTHQKLVKLVDSVL